MISFNKLDGYRLLHAGSLAIARAERAGIRIDKEIYIENTKTIKEKAKNLSESFLNSGIGKFWSKSFNKKLNLNSNSQLHKIMCDYFCIGDNKEEIETNEGFLLSLGISELADLVLFRKYEKLTDTYIASYIRESVDDFIHPSFSLHNAVTYRSSCSYPNLQGVPIRDEESMEYCRGGMFARRGHMLVEVDLRGAEVSCGACYHKDPEMVRYLNDKNSDMHADQAILLYKLEKFFDIINAGGFRIDPNLNRLRQGAKNGFVFPEFYGDYYKNCSLNLSRIWGKLPNGNWVPGTGVELPGGVKLSDHLISQNIKCLDDFILHVKKIEYNFWNKRFFVYNKWKKEWNEKYKKTGSFDMLSGFRCGGVMGKNESINHPIQGTAFHILLWSFIEVDKAMILEKWKSRLIGEVHDSMLLDVHPDELKKVIETINDIIKNKLKKHFEWINVPIDIEINVGEVDGSWATMRPYYI